MATTFLYGLTKALSDAGGGLQDWFYRIKPALEEQQYLVGERAYQKQAREEEAALRREELEFQRQERARVVGERAEARRLDEEERRRAAAERRLRGFLLWGESPEGIQKSFTVFGDAFRTAWAESGRGDLPTRTIPGAPGAPARTQVTVMPKTTTTPLERFRAGERGEPFVPKVYTKEISEVPAVPEHTELAIPGGPQPLFKTIGDVATATGNTLVDPSLASRPLNALPEGFNINSLFRPPSAPPKRVVIMDQTGRIINTIEAPAGTEIRQVTTPQGQIVVPIDPVTGQPKGQPYQLPPGARVVVTQQPRKGGAGGGGAGGISIPVQAKPGDTARWRMGSRGGRYAFIPEFGEMSSTSVSGKLDILAQSDPKLAAQRARELGLETAARRYERGGSTVTSTQRNTLERELLTLEKRMANLGAALRDEQDESRRRALTQQLQQTTRRRAAILTNLGQRGGQIQPVPPQGQPPTPARAAPSPRATQILAVWRQTKAKMPRNEWAALTPAEQQWLSSQGVGHD